MVLQLGRQRHQVRQLQRRRGLLVDLTAPLQDQMVALLALFEDLEDPEGLEPDQS